MIEILARCEDIVLVRKPCGMSSQPGERAGRDLVSALEGELGLRPHPLHRLDRDTEGVVALALNREAASAWSAVREGCGSVKRYLAVVAGSMGSASGTIDADIVQRGKRLEALTHWRVLRSFELGCGVFSLLEISLGTGRMHQIRIHLASSGHPILGDDKHGDFALNKELRKSLGVRKLMLLARELKLAGRDGRTISAVCPLPEHFASFLAEAEPNLDIMALEGRPA